MKQSNMQTVFKEFIGEFLGTAIMMSYGLSGIASNMLFEYNSPFIGPLAFGFGVIFAMFSCAQISGAHLNPAFSIALCTLGRLPAWKLGHYIVAQLFGSFFGSLLVYILYFQAFTSNVNILTNSTGSTLAAASIFITKPADHITLPVAMFDQVFLTALIVFAILFIIDEKCFQTPFAIQALIIGGTILSIGAATSYNCGAILNPARDLGPRILLYFLGYDKIVFKALNGHFWWAVGIISPCIGGVIGALFYRYIEKMRQLPKQMQIETIEQKAAPAA